MSNMVKNTLGTQENTKRNILLYGLTGILLAIFAYGAIVSLLEGHHAWATRNEMEWGILIAGYVYFAVGCTGICVLTTLAKKEWVLKLVFGRDSKYVKESKLPDMGIKPVILAISFIVAGFAILAMEMAYPLRLAIYMPTSPNFRSPFIWMGLFYGIYLVFLIIELILYCRNSKYTKLFGWLALITGISATSNLGAVFGTMPGRLYWTAPFLPLFFIFSGLLCGAAAMLILFYFADKENREVFVPYLSKLLILFIAITAIFNIWNILSSFIGQVPERYESLMFLLTGDLAISFWVFEIGLGLVLPFIMLFFLKSPKMHVAASFFVLIGMMVSRHNLIHAGQAYLLRPDLTNTPYFLAYMPTIVELSLIIGGVGVMLALYLILSKLVTRFKRDDEAKLAAPKTLKQAS